MYTTAELVLANYKPLVLEKGMLFMNTIHIGTPKECVEVWALDKLPQDIETFTIKNGYPVEFLIIDQEQNIMAEHHDIGYFDEGDELDTLRDITLRDLNEILFKYGGMLEIDATIEENEVIPIFREQKVVIRFPVEDYEEFFDDFSTLEEL